MQIRFRRYLFCKGRDVALFPLSYIVLGGKTPCPMPNIWDFIPLSLSSLRILVCGRRRRRRSVCHRNWRERTDGVPGYEGGAVGRRKKIHHHSQFLVLKWGGFLVLLNFRAALAMRTQPIRQSARLNSIRRRCQDCAVNVLRWAEGVVVGRLGHRVLELVDPFVSVIVVIVVLPSRLSCFQMVSANPLLLLLLLFWREDLFKRGYTALYSGLGLGEEFSSGLRLPRIGIGDRGPFWLLG